MRVSRQHHVDVRIVQDRQEQLLEVNVAVPGSVPERDVQQHDAGRGIAELLRGDRFAQPGSLLLAVCVVSPQPAVFDIRIRFVLTAVEHEHRHRSGHVEFVVAAPDLGEILLEEVGIDSARFVVAAVVEDRRLGGEGPDRGVDEIAVELSGAFGAVRHVAVEGHEVDLCEVDRAAEPGHVVGPPVDVVQNDEREVASRRGEGAERERLARVDVRCRDVAVIDLVVVFPLAHLL